jgi:hypothetical protein
MSIQHEILTAEVGASVPAGYVTGQFPPREEPPITPISEFRFNEIGREILNNLNELGKFEYDLKSINRKIYININRGVFHISFEKDDKTFYVVDEYETLHKREWFNTSEYDYVNYNEIYKLIKEDFNNQLTHLFKSKHNLVCNKLVPLDLFRPNISDNYYVYESLFLNKIVIQANIIDDQERYAYFPVIVKPTDIVKYVEDGNIIPYFQFIDNVSKSIKQFYKTVNILRTGI